VNPINSPDFLNSMNSVDALDSPDPLKSLNSLDFSKLYELLCLRLG
jgi:hypothetical protein